MNRTEASDLGKKAYLDGIDLFNSPSYLTALEQDAWREGYEDAMHAETMEFMKEDNDDVTSPSFSALDEMDLQAHMEWERDNFD